MTDAPDDTTGVPVDESREDDATDAPAADGADTPSAEGADSVDEMFGYGSAEEALDDAVTNLERVTAERDEYLDLARRVQAEFENYKRRVEGQRIEQRERAAEDLVIDILPVLDACEAALSHGHDDVAPIHSALLGALAKRGLAKVDDVGVTFDPAVHDAVLTEPATGDDEPHEGPLVAEVMRTGYSWNGRVVRPAMVKVRH